MGFGFGGAMNMDCVKAIHNWFDEDQYSGNEVKALYAMGNYRKKWDKWSRETQPDADMRKKAFDSIINKYVKESATEQANVGSGPRETLEGITANPPPKTVFDAAAINVAKPIAGALNNRSQCKGEYRAAIQAACGFPR